MKYFLSSMIALALATTGFAEPQQIFLPVDKIYTIERGFDTNDSVEVAVSGYLPNTCYKLGKGTAQVDQLNKEIVVNVTGFFREGICLEVMTPFLEVVQLNPLSKGEYKVRSLIDPRMVGNLDISEATAPTQDDFIYAPVDTVEVVEADDHQRRLVLKGTYPLLIRGCMRVTEVRTSVGSNGVLIVQPIASILEDHQCVEQPTDQWNRFEVSELVEVPPVDNGLVHVRTLNGRSLNKLVHF